MKLIKKIFSYFFAITPFKMALFVTIISALLFVSEDYLPLVSNMESKTLDFKYWVRGNMPPGQETCIVAADEKTTGVLGRWPYTRSVFAKMIDKLKSYGAKVIAFDAVFSEPDTNSSYQDLNDIIKQYSSITPSKQDQNFNEYLDSKIKSSNTDWIFKESLLKQSNIVLGYTWLLKDEEVITPIDKVPNQVKLLEPSEIKLIFTQGNDNTYSFNKVPYAKGIVINIPELAGATKYQGFFNAFADVDGYYRRAFTIIQNKGKFYPALGLLAAALYLDSSISVGFDNFGVNSVFLENNNILPVNEFGFLLINFRGKSRTFPHYSLSDVLNDSEQITASVRVGDNVVEKMVSKKDAFNNKVVVFGNTTIGIFDMRNTPVDKIYPGVEIHATVIDNIIHHDYLSSPTEIKMFELIFVIVSGLLFGYILSRLNAILGFLTASVIIVLYTYIDINLFFKNGILVSLWIPLAQTITIYLAITIYKYMSEERQKKQIKGAFQHYVASSIVAEILKDPTKLKLGGETKNLTVLFSDVRGFTTISEKLTAAQVVTLLNSYLTPMTDLVYKHDGTLDKYMGDAIMAFYGAPVTLGNHAEKACITALEMIAELKVLREGWVSQGLPFVDIGIGLNTGEMAVGNMGSKQIFDYTVLGDNVNLGSRLEGLNKQYGTNIIISEFTYAIIKDLFLVRELDLVKVKGKNEPVKIYELLAQKKDSHEYYKNGFIEKYNAAFQAYHAQEWDRCMQLFNDAHQINPNDKCCKLYIDRAFAMKQHPPGPDWDGVTTMTTK